MLVFAISYLLNFRDFLKALSRFPIESPFLRVFLQVPNVNKVTLCSQFICDCKNPLIFKSNFPVSGPENYGRHFLSKQKVIDK